MSNKDDDDNEIDLDDEEEAEEEQVDSAAKAAKAAAAPAQESPPLDKNKSNKKESLKDRVFRLKMKLNQARQLNRRQVLREGERLGSAEGQKKEEARLRHQDKDRRTKELQHELQEKSQMAGLEKGADKCLLEPAHASLAKSQKRAATAERNQYSVNDHYNPGGQHRHYERNLKAIPRDLDRTETSTYNPMNVANNNNSGVVSEKEGAKRLANEMKRRIEKQKKKRDRLEFEGEDVDYINKRNAHFNKKISRNYNKATAEIKQNLERGTAL